MLDSSPVPLPSSSFAFASTAMAIQARRPLKRTASTASLLTPPRTHRKHARGRSRGSCDSDSDDALGVGERDVDMVCTSDDDGELAANKKNDGKKRRRVGEVQEDAEEDAFWLGGAGLNAEGSSSGVKNANAASKSAAPLLYRRLLAQVPAEPDATLVSPPPSRRKTAAAGLVLTPSVNGDTAPSTPAVSPPVTPRRLTAKRAVRDSPDNPFLVPPKSFRGLNLNSDTESKGGSPSHSSHASIEKPTITYVFRGVRRTYQNPHYNHAANRPLSPSPGSTLPIEHPDFSPAMHCTPKFLFPEARRTAGGMSMTRKEGKGKKPPAKSRQRGLSLSDDESDEDGVDVRDIKPMKLTFGLGAPDKKF